MTTKQTRNIVLFFVILGHLKWITMLSFGTCVQYYLLFLITVLFSLKHLIYCHLLLVGLCRSAFSHWRDDMYWRQILLDHFEMQPWWSKDSLCTKNCAHGRMPHKISGCSNHYGGMLYSHGWPKNRHTNDTSCLI